MIPARYQHVEYDDVPENIKASFEIMNKTRRGMFIHGPYGTGKTHIMHALRNEWKKRSGKYPLFYSTTKLLHETREDYDRPYGEKKRYLEKVMEDRGVLFLDDFGAEKVSDWVNEKFFLLIDEKYVNSIPVIISSNYTLAELKERIDERIVSRILEMCDRFKVDGVDRRFDKAVNQ